MMSQLQTRISWGLLLFCVSAVLVMTIASGQAPRQRPVVELLPANTVAFLAQDGSARHKATWENTAAYEALYDSGMMEVVEKIFAFIGQQAGQQDNAQLQAAVKHIEDQGLSLAISLAEQGPPLPHLTLVLHNAAALQPSLVEFATSQLRMLGMKLAASDYRGRTVHSAMIPQSRGIEVSFWAEGQHLVVVAGINAVANAVAVADGEMPHLATSRVWQKYRFETATSEATSVAWIDFTLLRNTFGDLPIPRPGHGTVNDGLSALGLHNLSTLAWQFGYKGRALWSEGHVEVDGERTGLLSLTNQRPFTLQDLPPLPPNVGSFSATRIDQAELWTTLTTVARNVAALGPSDASQEVDRVLNQVQQTIGFDITAQLMDPLGDILCVFTDSNQSFFGAGIGVAIKVDDADKLRTTIDNLLTLATDGSRGDFTVRRTERYGCEIVLFQFAQQVQVGALAIDKDWMVLSLVPQTIGAFALRADGRLPAWKPTRQQAEAFAELPTEFTSISVGDPRVGWRSLMKLAPPALVAAEIALKENGVIPRDLVIPITTADIPPAELVVNPLFPNVSVTVVDEIGVHTTTRRSMPAIPLVGGIGAGSSAVTVSVAVALLLPAVQAAREAARRAQSSNNLKQLALSLHNYHSSYQSFPAGSYANEKLKPNKRFSWLARVLPFLEQSLLYEKLDFEEAWDDEANADMVDTRVRTLLNPGYGVDDNGPGKTHYVGMAGVGKDAPSLAVNHPRAGIFGDNRQTRISDIIDGTSNTIMVTEASDKFGAWSQGGNATYRPLTKKPYINGPDGIGGPFRGGCNMAFGDGSVRFISENIDPSVLEALSTMAGREVTPRF